MGVTRVEPSEARWQGEVSSPENPYLDQTISFAQLSQAAEVEDRLVRPGDEVASLSTVQSEGIPDAKPLRADVREREDLPAEDRRADVDPAAAVLRAQDGATAGTQHPGDLRDEQVDVGHGFEDL